MKFWKSVKIGGRKVLENAHKSNPLMYEDISMYEYKLKKFFCLCALGMDSTKKWIRMDGACVRIGLKLETSNNQF